MAHKRIEDADYAMIAEYERQLDHLINGHYLVGVGHTAVTRLREWWQRYTGKEYAVNENFGFTMRRYFDEETNEWVDKALVVTDGKALNPTGFVLIKKA